MKVKIPEAYQAEHAAKQIRLFKSRITIFCIATIGIYLFASFFLILIRPEEFRRAEIPIWGVKLTVGALILYINRKTRTLPSAKLVAYLFTVFVLFVLVVAGLIYVEDAAFSSVYYVLCLFFVSLILPWNPADVILLASMHVGAYSLFFALSPQWMPAGVPVPFTSQRYVDGVILLFISLIMCFLIRRRETARDLENFLLLKEVEEKNEQIRKELELARRIHKTLIPESVSTERADISVTYLPVNYIGGDYAKFHFLGDNKLIFIICDVTGHGVPAALLVNRIHAEFERLAKDGKEPGLLLKELDHFITEDFAGTSMYLTAFCGLLDFSGKNFLYSNYGHPPQYLYQSRSGEIRRLQSQTTLLGLSFQDQKVFQNQIGFEPKDRILLFTDGVTESTNAQGREFGSERLENFLKTNDLLPHQKFNQALVDELNAHRRAEFQDDIFLLSIKIN